MCTDQFYFVFIYICRQNRFLYGIRDASLLYSVGYSFSRIDLCICFERWVLRPTWNIQYCICILEPYFVQPLFFSYYGIEILPQWPAAGWTLSAAGWTVTLKQIYFNAESVLFPDWTTGSLLTCFWTVREHWSNYFRTARIINLGNSSFESVPPAFVQCSYYVW